jgi:hypothetical protein
MLDVQEVEVLPSGLRQSQEDPKVFWNPRQVRQENLANTCHKHSWRQKDDFDYRVARGVAKETGK